LLDTRELAVSSDDVGPGHPTQPIALTSIGGPRLGQILCASFASPRGVAALALSPGTPRLPAQRARPRRFASRCRTTRVSCSRGSRCRGFADHGCVLATNGVGVRIQPIE